jgi:hypothetical protein
VFFSGVQRGFSGVFADLAVSAALMESFDDPAG